MAVSIVLARMALIEEAVPIAECYGAFYPSRVFESCSFSHFEACATATQYRIQFMRCRFAVIIPTSLPSTNDCPRAILINSKNSVVGEFV
jgi:hypothetical protein